VEKLLTRLPVRKPGKQEFVRVHQDEAYRVDLAILELKEERETYAVSPTMHEQLLGEIVPARLFTAVTRQGVAFLWPCKLPIDGRANAWYDSLLEAAEMAMTKWVRVVANVPLGAYDTYVATADLPAPEWPEQSLAELLKLGFGSFYIDSPDHPVVRRLRGGA
jgi:hypothetical protein